MNSVSPQWLPQVSAPFVHVLKGLDDNGVGYENVSMPLSKLKPLQGIVDFDKVDSIVTDVKGGIDTLKTIWVSQDNEILDGHHRYVAALKLNPEGSISCMRILANHKDAARILNKICDLYDSQNTQQPQDEILPDQATNDSLPVKDGNTEPADNSDVTAGVKLGAPVGQTDISGDNMIPLDLGENKPQGGRISLTVYRKAPLKEKAISGNFFHLQPKEGFDKYEIEFDNLLDAKSTEIGLNRANPVVDFCRHWCKIGDLEGVAQHHGVPIDKYAAKLIADKARGMGYDGIKYGDILVQAF